MEKIVYEIDGNLHIITPCADYIVKDKDGKETTIIGLELAHKDIPDSVEYKIIDESELPKDRIFRNAWGYDLKEDVTKSKEIWKEKLRADRMPLLCDQDIELLMAQETGADTTDILAEKQRLRDITSLVDGCTTITQIKKVKV